MYGGRLKKLRIYLHYEFRALSNIIRMEIFPTEEYLRRHEYIFSL